jgi:hypothetical protein
MDLSPGNLNAQQPFSYEATRYISKNGKNGTQLCHIEPLFEYLSTLTNYYNNGSKQEELLNFLEGLEIIELSRGWNFIAGYKSTKLSTKIANGFNPEEISYIQNHIEKNNGIINAGAGNSVSLSNSSINVNETNPANKAIDELLEKFKEEMTLSLAQQLEQAKNENEPEKKKSLLIGIYEKIKDNAGLASAIMNASNLISSSI